MNFMLLGELPILQLIVGAIVLIVLVMVFYLMTRFKRCPSDQILVVYGKVGEGQSSMPIHGGGKLVLPLIQDYQFLSLTPMTINIPLQNALSLQNIRIHVPSTFTVGISTEKAIMKNAADRLLGLRSAAIEDMAREIIFGQLRLTVAALTIEEINQDRERFMTSIRKNVEPELNKIGLYLINVNITDITDESDYIESIGKKAAAEATNKAMIDVAEQEKVGKIGQAEAIREQEIKVAENLAEAAKGKKSAEADKRIFVQNQEAAAITGENDSKAKIAETNAGLAIKVAENQAAADKGKKAADADRRVFVQAQEATAVAGENEAAARIAAVNADLAVKEAAALKQGEVAKRQAEVEIQKAQYEAEQERLNAEEVVRKEVDRRKIEIEAAAEAEKIRLVSQGRADAVLMKYEAEAKGVRQVLDAKAQGYESLIKSCDGDARAAATLLMIEKLEDIVKQQVEAIKNIKIDKVTVWDGGAGSNGEGGSSTANFLASMAKTLPPLQDVASMAGVELPEFLGKVKDSQDSGKNKPTPENLKK